jgi:parvulin-like peptidyl-prolyl isomerase
MYKILLLVFLSSFLQAELVDGVAIVVKGEAITLYDLKEEMRLSKVSLEAAKEVLIRKKLEDAEIKERKIKVSSSEVYDEIKKIAQRNNMKVSELYEAVRSASGLTSTEFKTKTRERLLSQKLYSAIAYQSLEEPTEDEIEEYYQLHKNNFAHPAGFTVIIYTSKDKARLKEKMDNPMFYSPDLHAQEKHFEYDKISPELAKFLEKQKLNTFTPIVPNGKGAYMSFYIKEIESAKEAGFRTVKNQIINLMMGDKREQVLSDYFARLKGNADIKVVRLPKDVK